MKCENRSVVLFMDNNTLLFQWLKSSLTCWHKLQFTTGIHKYS